MYLIIYILLGRLSAKEPREASAWWISSLQIYSSPVEVENIEFALCSFLLGLTCWQAAISAHCDNGMKQTKASLSNSQTLACEFSRINPWQTESGERDCHPQYLLQQQQHIILDVVKSCEQYIIVNTERQTGGLSLSPVPRLLLISVRIWRGCKKNVKMEKCSFDGQMEERES